MQLRCQQPTYANPNPQPIKVQIQNNSSNQLANSIRQSAQNSVNSINAAAANRANYAAAAASRAQAFVYASQEERSRAIEI